MTKPVSLQFAYDTIQSARASRNTQILPTVIQARADVIPFVFVLRHWAIGTNIALCAMYQDNITPEIQQHAHELY